MNLHTVMALAFLTSSQANESINLDGTQQPLVDEDIWQELMKVKSQLTQTQQEMEGDLLTFHLSFYANQILSQKGQ